MSTAIVTTPTAPFTLERDRFGRLILTLPDGTRFESVAPVRAFPIQAPEDGISLVSTDGAELAWVDHLSQLQEPEQGLIRAELAAREFMPVIEAIVGVTSFSTPCTWTVRTDRGQTEFVLRGDEDIRRIGKEHALLIADNHGIQYLVRDQFALDAQSKKILDRFM